MSISGTPSFRHGICPACGQSAVKTHNFRAGIFKPKFVCASCGAKLMTAPTTKFFAFLAFGVAGIFAISVAPNYLQQHYAISSEAVRYLQIGLLGAWLGYVIHHTFDGLVFKAWRRGGL